MSDAPASQAQGSRFQLNAAPSAWTAAALNAVPKGAVLDIEVAPGGPADVVLIHGDHFASLPATDHALYTTRTTSRARFSIVAPEAGDYALVLSNPSDRIPLSAEIKIEAKAPGGLSAEEFEETANQMLSAVSEAIGGLFRFGNPGLHARRTGSTAPFSETGDGLAISTEFSLLLMAKTAPAATSPLMMLAIFHRLADRIADRSLTLEDRDALALATMTMLGYREHAEAALTALTTSDAASALRNEMDDGEDAIPDFARATAAQEKLRGDTLVEDWHDVLLGALADETLAKMAADPPPWTTAPAIRAEQGRRAA